jgi:heme/copper-type cytochrome/quinol oxidase subunit 4
LKVAYPPAKSCGRFYAIVSLKFSVGLRFVPTWAVMTNDMSISRQFDAILKLHLGFVVKVASLMCFGGLFVKG